LGKLITKLRYHEHGGEYLNTRYEILQLDPHSTHLVVIAELINAALPEELVSRLLLFDQSSKVLVKLSPCLIVDK